MDRILIESLVCRAHVGVPLAERRRRQKLVIDLELEGDLREAGRTDQVKATIDYAAAARRVKEIVEEGSFRLVEAAAEQAAGVLLSEFKPTSVRVRIRKFSVRGAASVGVEIRRSRPGRSRKRSPSPRTGLR